MTSAAHKGRCACSHVEYELASEPMFVHCCHCRSCQREGGSSYAVNALIETDRVRVTKGEVEVVETATNSGKGQRIARCPRCKVALWSHYAYAGIGDAVRFLRVGTLDDADAVPPDIHIYTVSKQRWISLDPAIPAVAEFYKASDYWPAESLARRAALFEAKSASPR